MLRWVHLSLTPVCPRENATIVFPSSMVIANASIALVSGVCTRFSIAPCSSVMEASVGYLVGFTSTFPVS